MTYPVPSAAGYPYGNSAAEDVVHRHAIRARTDFPFICFYCYAYCAQPAGWPVHETPFGPAAWCGRC